MRTFATLKNLSTPEGRDVIVRNLNRILGIVILDLDIENGTITFLHASQTALEKAKRELYCLGFPMLTIQIQNWKRSDNGLPQAFS